MPETTKKVTALAYHRNGISGAGFYVATVQEGDTEKLVIRFPDADKEVGGIVCAVLDLGILATAKGAERIEFGYNSWRGDHYHDLMDDAIKQEEGN